jgi:hypothetical protein
VVSRKSEDQCNPERHDAQSNREDDRDADRGPVRSAAHQCREIVEADPLRRSPEGIGQLESLDETPECRNKEEEQERGELRSKQQVGQRAVFER